MLSDIHNQLKGNKDYINSNIVLSDNNRGTEENLVTVYITEEVINVTEIIL